MSNEGFSHMTSTLLSVVKAGNYLILDTETTGLYDGEICQIAVIDSSGAALVDTFVKTARPIPPDATAIHHITDEMVALAPGWADVSVLLQSVLRGHDVIVYNAVYDRKMMHRSAEAAGCPKVDWRTFSTWHCAMEAFAEIYGDWNSYHQSYRWQKLGTAARYYNIPESAAHSALGDCLTTLAVVKAMAGV